MMVWIAVSLLALSLLFAVLQLGFVRLFRGILAEKRRGANEVPLGKVAILLAVRGCDPSFRDCLGSLLALDHPDFEIQITVDSVDDTAWPVIRKLQETGSAKRKLVAENLTDVKETCGLKCSAHLQSLKRIGPGVEFIALVDSDTIVDRNWLNELLAGLADPKNGVATGNQWFEPKRGDGVASWLRLLWQAGAIVPTVVYRNPWAGSLVMRKSDFDRADVAGRWETAIVDDGPLRSAIRSTGRDVCFVPHAIQVNRESCSGKYVVNYIRRMLTWSRLFEPTYWATIVHAIVVVTLLVGPVVLGCIGLAGCNWCVLTFAVLALLVNFLAAAFGLFAVRHAISKLRPGEIRRWSVSESLKALFLLPVAQVLYSASVFTASFARRVTWRGATYRIGRRGSVRLVNRPPTTNGTGHSV